MTMTVSPLQPATSQQVRSKFFNMIGIEPSGKSPSSKQQEDSVACADRSKWVHPRIQQVNKSQASLKYDKRDDRIFSPKRSRRQESSPQSPSPKKQKKCISFDEDVSVIPIPMRTEYSCRVRQRMWSNANEIHQNAARNTVEFISEGWNWRNVTEDESMYLCVATGELIHPVHYANLGIKPGDCVP